MSFIRKFESKPGPCCDNLLVAGLVCVAGGRETKQAFADRRHCSHCFLLQWLYCFCLICKLLERESIVLTSVLLRGHEERGVLR